MCAPLRGIWCLYGIFGMEMQGWIIHCVVYANNDLVRGARIREERIIVSVKVNPRWCPRAICAPFVCATKQPSTQGMHSYFGIFGQIHFVIFTNTFCNLGKYYLQFWQICLAVWTITLCDLLHSYAQQNNPQLKASTPTLFLFEQIHFVIWTITIYNFDKYVQLFEQLHFAICSIRMRNKTTLNSRHPL